MFVSVNVGIQFGALLKEAAGFVIAVAHFSFSDSFHCLQSFYSNRLHNDLLHGTPHEISQIVEGEKKNLTKYELLSCWCSLDAGICFCWHAEGCYHCSVSQDEGQSFQAEILKLQLDFFFGKTSLKAASTSLEPFLIQ